MVGTVQHSTTATLGTKESDCCGEGFKQESMYGLSARNVPVVER